MSNDAQRYEAMRARGSGRSGRAAVVLKPDARALVALLEQEKRKAKSPAGAFVLIAARLNSPASEVAAMCGLPLRTVHDLVRRRGIIVTAVTLRRLGAWVALLWSRVAEGKDQAALLAAAWEAPVPVEDLEEKRP